MSIAEQVRRLAARAAGPNSLSHNLDHISTSNLLRCAEAERVLVANGFSPLMPKAVKLPANKSLRLVDASVAANGSKSANGSGHTRGAQAELIACAYLLDEGYEVFKNVSPCGPADIIAWKGGDVLRIDVKSGKTAMRTSKQIDEGVVLLYVDDNGHCGFEPRAKVILTEEQQNETDHPPA